MRAINIASKPQGFNFPLTGNFVTDSYDEPGSLCTDTVPIEYNDAFRPVPELRRYHHLTENLIMTFWEYKCR